MDLARVINGKKYMWDKIAYEDKKSADDAATNYKTDNFETEVIEEEGNYYVFSRRVVTEVVVEGAPI